MFKKRHGIRLHKAHGEADSVSTKIIQSGREELEQDLAGHAPKDIYNMDENRLFYRLEPNATLVTAPVAGKKKSKDRVPLALCSNADVSHKLKALIIGKSTKPRCFSGGLDPSMDDHSSFKPG